MSINAKMLGEEPKTIHAMKLKNSVGEFTGTTQVIIKGTKNTYFFDLVEVSKERQNERVAKLWRGLA